MTGADGFEEMYPAKWTWYDDNATRRAMDRHPTEINGFD